MRPSLLERLGRRARLERGSNERSPSLSLSFGLHCASVPPNRSWPLFNSLETPSFRFAFPSDLSLAVSRSIIMPLQTHGRIGWSEVRGVVGGIV